MRYGPIGGGGGSVILVWHCLSIVSPALYPGFKGDARKHNTLFFEHNPTDSRGRAGPVTEISIFATEMKFSHLNTPAR